MNVVELDARGLLCPMPVIKLAREAQEARPGTMVRLQADDPAARVDVPAWCRMRGHELVSRADDTDSSTSTFEVRVRPTP